MVRSALKSRTWLLGALFGAALISCGDEEEGETQGIVGDEQGLGAGEEAVDPATIAQEGGPPLFVIAMEVPVFEKPDTRSAKLGYLRLGETVTRGEKPVEGDLCDTGYYQVLPRGYVCGEVGATADPQHPIVRAAIPAADRTRPMPYTYAFVRRVVPRYIRLPTYKEQKRYEYALREDERVFKRNKDKWHSIKLGANDVPVDETGHVTGELPEEPPDMSTNEMFGGDDDLSPPWWLEDGRQLPNISGYDIPKASVKTDRLKRYAGVSLINAFDGEKRHFALTTDLRLIPTSRLKPGRGSTFHGVELGDEWQLPIGFVKRDKARHYVFQEKKGRFRQRQRAPRYSAVRLTGKTKRNGKHRMVETIDGMWLRTRDVAVSPKVTKLPHFAKPDVKWIDVAIQYQTLVLYEGRTPVYATMISSGRDGYDDPKTTYSTVRGNYRIQTKHVAKTMDSDTVGSRFDLIDVPYVQYFHTGYALHAAYWHSDFGHPRSHGCINLSPIDAMRIFHWSAPHVPAGWHGIEQHEANGLGTRIFIHK